MSKGPERRSVISRVLDKLQEENGCLLFQGGRDLYNYGMIWDNDRRTKVRAHRVIYEHYHGTIDNGLVVRHTCDNPPCCNIEHLEVGTQQENVADMVSRGRASKRPGEAHPNAVLTEDSVLEIRRLRSAEGLTYKELAVNFGVSSGLIAHIVTRRSWKHI